MANISDLIAADTAQKELEAAGSIMARPEKPEWRKQNPLIDTLMSMLDVVASGVSPTDAGGAKGAVLGPIGKTASKYVNQAQKKVVKAIFRHDPEMLKAVQNEGRMMQVFTPTKPGAEVMMKSGDLSKDAYATYRGSSTMPSGQVTVPPTTMRGLSPSGRTSEDLGSLPQIAAHEATHFLNEPRIYDQLAGKDAVAMYNMLVPFLSRHGKSAALSGGLNAGLPQVALDEALAYLTGPGTRSKALSGVAKRISEALKVRAGSKPGEMVSQELTPENVRSIISQSADADMQEMLNKASRQLRGLE